MSYAGDDFPLLLEEGVVMTRAFTVATPIFHRQHALATGAQLRSAGIHPQVVARLVARGVWERIDHSLYGPAGVPMTWHRELMAATLLGPPGTRASHRATAALLEVGGLDDPMPEVSIPEGSSMRRSGVVVHESCDLDLDDHLCVLGIPTTGPLRLAVDLGSVVSFERYKHTIRELRHGRGVSTDALLRTYLRHSQRGRNGCGALRDWLDRYHGVKGRSESGLELRVLDAIIDAGLPSPVRQLEVRADGRGYRLDLAYPDLMLAIEVDGAQHEDWDVAPGDQSRTERLERAGWTVIRIRSWKYATDLAAALRRIRSAVASSQGV